MEVRCLKDLDETIMSNSDKIYELLIEVKEDIAVLKETDKHTKETILKHMAEEEKEVGALRFYMKVLLGIDAFTLLLFLWYVGSDNMITLLTAIIGVI